MYVDSINKDIFSYPPVISNETLPWSFNIFHTLDMDEAALQKNWRIYLYSYNKTILKQYNWYRVH